MGTGEHGARSALRSKLPVAFQTYIGGTELAETDFGSMTATIEVSAI